MTEGFRPDIPQSVLDQIYAAIDAEIYGISPYVALRAAQYGHSLADAVRVARRGTPIEWYPDRNRALFAGQVTIEGRVTWLHVVIGYARHVPVGLATAYVPNPTEWVDPPIRRRTP